MIRPAQKSDVPALERLEVASFPTDRLSRQRFLAALRNPRADMLVDVEPADILRGYALVFYRQGAREARLYSIAVAAAQRGHGIGKALLAALEAGARARGCTSMRLEVRAADPVAQGLYHRSGYTDFGRYPDYYEDHAEALRLRKALTAPPAAAAPAIRPARRRTCHFV